MHNYNFFLFFNSSSLVPQYLSVKEALLIADYFVGTEVLLSDDFLFLLVMAPADPQQLPLGVSVEHKTSESQTLNCG